MHDVDGLRRAVACAERLLETTPGATGRESVALVVAARSLMTTIDQRGSRPLADGGIEVVRLAEASVIAADRERARRELRRAVSAAQWWMDALAARPSLLSVPEPIVSQNRVVEGLVAAV